MACLQEGGVEHALNDQPLYTPAAHVATVWSPDCARIGATVPVGPDGLRVGRGARDPSWLGLPCEDRRASRDHFTVQWSGTRLAVRDSGTRNGTLVNGVLVPAHGVVSPQDGAVIRAGDTLLVLRAGSPGLGTDPDAWTPGASPPANSVRGAIGGISAKAGGPALFLGEPGTGKQMAARWLHARLADPERPWVHVWCGDAMRSRDGASVLARAATARGGILFLEDVGQLNEEVQRMLLGAIRWWTAEGTLQVIGAASALPVSSPGPLVSWLASGDIVRFPPLRERREDIPALAIAVGERRVAGVPLPPLRCWDPDLVEALLLFRYPRNLHDLSEIMVTAAMNAAGAQCLELRHLPASLLTAWGAMRPGSDPYLPWRLP